MEGNTMRKKKLLALSLAMSMGITLLGGCGGTAEVESSPESTVPEKTDSEGEKEPSSETAQSEDGMYEYPLVEDALTLTAFRAKVEHVSDPATNSMIQAYEEKTGIHIEWIESSDWETDLNLMIAGEETADLWLVPFDTTRIQTMTEAGMLLPLNDLIEQYGYYTKQMWEENPDFKEIMTAPDGNIYTMIETDVGVHMPNRRKMFVKADWLEAYRKAAGKETAPENIAEFEEMLQYFRDNDMNGNGKQDEIPLMGSNHAEDDPIYYLMSAFQQISNNFFHIDEKGEIVFEANTESWREGLRWMNHLYQEELFAAEETYVQDRDQLRAIVNVSEASNYVVGAIPTFWEGRFVDSSVLNWTDFEPIPPIAGEDGVARATITSPESIRLVAAISSTCKDPEAALKWLDWWMSEEGAFVNVYGVKEGEDYEWVDIPSISGEERSVRVLKNSYTDNFRLGENTVPKLDRQSIRYAVSLDESTFNTNNTYVLYRAGKMYEPYYVPQNVPTIVWSNDMDLQNEVNEYMSVVGDTVRTAYTEFILGIRDIDTEWEDYLGELESVGLEHYLELLSQYYAQ